MNTEKIWDFIEKYYPNYYTSEGITDNGDLRMILDGQEEEGSHAWRIKEDIKSSVSFGRLYDPKKLKDNLFREEVQNRYNESCKAIYEKAIEGYLESQKEKETVTMTFSIADIDQAMEENDIDYPLTDHGKLEALRHAKEHFDANASYWDNILEGVLFVINKSNGIKS